jgi:hypothetical protein
MPPFFVFISPLNLFFFTLLPSLLLHLLFNSSLVSSHNLTQISIGAFYNLNQIDGTLDLSGVQTKEAILMAIREINNKSDGLYDDLLPGIQFKLATQHPGIMFSTATIAANILRKSFNGTGIRACIGPGTNAGIAGEFHFLPSHMTSP